MKGDGALIPARVVEAPRLGDLAPQGQDVTVVLETEDGTTVTIRGETVLSTFMVMGPKATPGWQSGGASGGEHHFQMQQAIVHYTWDGETANGMMERSTMTDQIR